MSQLQKVQGRNTTVFTDATGALCCAYHATIVAKRSTLSKLTGPTYAVTLNSGGWRTASTKTRMNQFANQHCGGAFAVYQTGDTWIVRVGTPKEFGTLMDFADGMTFEVVQ